MDLSDEFYVCHGCTKGYYVRPEGGSPVFWAMGKDIEKVETYNEDFRKSKKRIRSITPSIHGNKSRRLRGLSWG